MSRTDGRLKNLRKSTATGVAAAAVLSLLAGCGSSDGGRTSALPDELPSSVSPTVTSETPSPGSEDGTNSPSPTASPTQADGATGTVSVKDADGYTLNVKYSYSLLSVDKVIASEKPGLNSAVMREHSTISVINTTPGRDLTFERVTGITPPLSDPHLYLVGLWKLTSPVCSVAVEGQMIDSSGPVKYCGVTIAFGRLPDTVSAGQTVDLQVYSGLENGVGLAGVAHVPDADYPAVSEALQHPDNFEIVYSAQDNARFASSCAPGDDSDAGGANVYNGVPLWARTGRCNQYSGISQPAEE